MNLAPKFWLCGMIQNCVEDANALTVDIYNCFDGLIFIDHLSTDGTREVLESRKKEGHIIQAEFLNHHGWSMNAILNSNKIIPGDILVFVDSKERICIDFAQKIRLYWDSLLNQGIHTVFLYGKILMLCYYPNITFTYITPHCVVQDYLPKVVDFANSEFWKDESKSRYNIRPQSRSKDHFIDHFVKYCFQYSRPNNQMTCGREGNANEYKIHEGERLKFITYCARYLKIDLTVEALKTYIRNNHLDNYMREYFNFEKYFNDFYCYHVLNHSLEDIIKRHEKKELFLIQ